MGSIFGLSVLEGQRDNRRSDIHAPHTLTTDRKSPPRLPRAFPFCVVAFVSRQLAASCVNQWIKWNDQTAMEMGSKE